MTTLKSPKWTALLRMASNKPSFDDNFFKHKGKGDEDVYFSRKDREVLKAYREKMEKSSSFTADENEIEKHQAKIKLAAIFSSHQIHINDDLIQDLLK